MTAGAGKVGWAATVGGATGVDATGFDATVWAATLPAGVCTTFFLAGRGRTVSGSGSLVVWQPASPTAIASTETTASLKPVVRMTSPEPFIAPANRVSRVVQIMIRDGMRMAVRVIPHCPQPGPAVRDHTTADLQHLSTDALGAIS